MATPETGTITFTGLKSGNQYGISVYASDVVAAACTFSTVGVAVAGSQNFYIIPEDVVISDISIHTGMGTTTALVPYSNDVPTGAVFTAAGILDTLAFRSVPHIGFAAGRKFTLIQA